jgi:hypothetical protein
MAIEQYVVLSDGDTFTESDGTYVVRFDHKDIDSETLDAFEATNEFKHLMNCKNVTKYSINALMDLYDYLNSSNYAILNEEGWSIFDRVISKD